MKKLLSPLYLIVAIMVLGACSSTGLPDPARPWDWCYILDFRVISNIDAVPGLGLRSNDGYLDATYIHNATVEAGEVKVMLEFYHEGSAYPAGSDFTVQSNIFGITKSMQGTIPWTVNEYEIQIRPDYSGAIGNQADVTINITNGEVVIPWVMVSGWGINPFPYSETGCAPVPPTTATALQLPTVTASATSSPTASSTPSPTGSATATASSTPTASNTPSSNWQCIYDFGVSDYGWAAGTQFPTVSRDSSGWHSVYEPLYGTYYVALEMYQPANMRADGQPVTVTDLEVNHTMNPGPFPVLPSVITIRSGQTLLSWGNANNIPEPIISNTPHTLSTGYLLRFYATSGPNTGNITVHKITIKGSGLAPDICPSTPTTPTPTGTSTLSAAEATGTALAAASEAANATSTAGAMITATAGANASSTAAAIGTSTAETFSDRCNFINFSFDGGLSPWVGTAARGQGAAIFQAGEHLSQNAPLKIKSYFLTLVTSVDQPGGSSADGDLSFTYVMTKPGGSTTSATTATRTEQYMYQNGNQVALTLPIEITEAGTYGFKLTANLSNVLSVRVLSACVSEVLEGPNDNQDGPGDGSGGWHTCGEIITPPSSVTEIGGWIKYLWDNTNKIIQCVIMPPVEAIRDFVVGAFTWFFNTITGFVEWSFGQLLPFVFGTIRNVFAALLELVRHGFGDIFSVLSAQLSAVGAIAGDIGDILSSYSMTGRAYMGVAVFQVNSVVNSYNYAASTPPAGLPDCIAAPMNHELCAVFWVMENTFFSGFIGGLLIPAICVFIDMLIIMYFGNMIKRFLIRLWSMFS